MPERTAPEPEADSSYARHAGRMLWPRNANDLTDTTLCPACHASLPSAVCPACGLDLRHPAAVALLAASTDAANALERRAALVGRIRFDTAHAPASTPTPTPAEPAPEPTRALAPVTGPAAAAESARPQPAAHPPRRKRSSVQILLLLVGVTLVSVAAIFFLTVAWLFAGLEMRSAIVGLFTAAALVIAAVLSRKGLAATAEGIGALAVVLVLLDAWALRENNLFGLAATDETLYWGVALLGCAALFFAAHALSRLRIASVAGFTVAAPGLGLLVAGLASAQAGTTQVFLACLGTAVGALIHRFTLQRDSAVWPSIDRVPERMILLLLGGLSLVGAFLTAAFVDPDSVGVPLWTFGAVALVAALHVAQVVTTNRPQPAARLFAYGCAALASLAATLIAPTVALRAEDTALSLTAPLLSAAALALALELVLRRLPAGTPSMAATWAAVTASAMAAGSAAYAIGWAGRPLADSVATGLTGVTDPVASAELLATIVSVEPESAWALATLAAVGGLAALFWALGGILRAREHVVAWLALVVIVFAVPFAGSLWLVLFAFLLLGALALCALLLAGQGRLNLGPYRPVVIALVIAAETFGYLISWAGSDSWWIGTISAVLVVFFARLLFDRTSGATARGALLAGAVALALIGAAAAPSALTIGLDPSAAAALINTVRSLTLATALLQVAIAVAWRGALFSETERRWAFWTLLGPTVLAFAASVTTSAETLSSAERATLLQSEPAAAITHAALLLAAPLLWVLARGNQAVLPRERFVAAIALAPTTLLLVWTIIRATDAPAPVESIAVPAVALVVCAIALALGTLRAGVRERLGLEIGAAIILVPAVGAATGPDRTLGWLTLVLAGVAALIVAIAPDGLFASRSPRRHVGWLALALGTAGLWLGLSRAGEDALEPYVLPVAGVLLVVAALIRRFGRVDRTVAASPVAALLTLAGLSVAVVPLALAGQTGSLVRPIVVGTVSAVLLLAASSIRWTPPWAAYLAAVGLAGATGVFLTAAGRVGRVLTAPGGPDGRLEAWLLPAALVFAAAGTLTVVAARRGDAALAPPSVASRTRFGYGLVIAAILGILLAEALALDFAPLAAIRVILLAWTFSALHLAAFWLDPSPLGRLVSWVAIGAGGAIVLAGYSYSAPDPIEIVSVPLAVALLTSGWLHLDATPSARSWPWLAPGLLVLLVPSLLLDVTESPLWRVVGLGVLAVAVVVVGAARRLQAPFVIGAVVLLIHALAQLWPWIALAYGSAPWWLWLGIGGVILIILAARYEQRIKNLRSVALMISGLR